MIDFHTHILPAIDDGARTMEESLKMLEEGSSAGINTFVLTPHLRAETDWEKLGLFNDLFSELKQKFSATGRDAELLLGAEIAITHDLSARLKSSPGAVIEKKLALVEFPFFQLPVFTEDALYGLLIDGITPIIAHPERYMYLDGKLRDVSRWVDNGVKLQINAGSLSGLYGSGPKGLAKKLLKEGLAHAFGSDAHSPGAWDKYKSALNVAEKLLGGPFPTVLAKH